MLVSILRYIKGQVRFKATGRSRWRAALPPGCRRVITATSVRWRGGRASKHKSQKEADCPSFCANAAAEAVCLPALLPE